MTSGHIPTRASQSFMPALLSSDRYTTLSMGDDWQDSVFQNERTGNIFHGEPNTGWAEPFAQGFETDGLEWDIAYHFSGTRNNVFPNGKYGTRIKTDRLYYILVNRLNGGIDFVQSYLNDVAPYTMGDAIKRVVEPAVRLYRQAMTDWVVADEKYKAEMKGYRNAKRRYDRSVDKYETVAKNNEEVYNKVTDDYVNIVQKADAKRTKSGAINRSLKYTGKLQGEYKGMRLADLYDDALERYQLFLQALESGQYDLPDVPDEPVKPVKPTKPAKPKWSEASGELAKELHDDFVNALASGAVPLLNNYTSDAVAKRREKAGIDDTEHAFFASGQFADSIVFDVRIRNG